MHIFGSRERTVEFFLFKIEFIYANVAVAVSGVLTTVFYLPTVPPLPPISEQIVLSFKGQTIQLSADLDMAPIPEPTYIWRSESRGFIPMEQEQRGGQRVYVTTGGRLVIRNITVCDSGNYSCIVENEHGRSMQVVTLEVFATMPPLSTVALLRFHIAEECESREVSMMNVESHFHPLQIHVQGLAMPLRQHVQL